jgi:hypothetical protein
MSSIPFIVYDENKGFIVTEESKSFLSSIQEEIAIISVVGK